MGHAEYSRETLSEEYFRDKNKGMETVLPYNYFPNNDPDNIPLLNWKCHANLMFSNWLNYCIYQSTPVSYTHLDVYKRQIFITNYKKYLKYYLIFHIILYIFLFIKKHL